MFDSNLSNCLIRFQHFLKISFLLVLFNIDTALANEKCSYLFKNKNSSQNLTTQLSANALLKLYLNEDNWPFYKQLPNASRRSYLDEVLLDLMQSSYALEFYEAAKTSRDDFNLFTKNIDENRQKNREILEKLEKPTGNLTRQQQQKMFDLFILSEYFGFLHRPLNLYLIGDKARARHLYTMPINAIYQKYKVSIEAAIDMLKNALDRSTGSKGLYFRGHSNLIEKYSHLNEGDELIEPGFLSASTSIRNTYEKQVMFVILANNAKSGLNFGEAAEVVMNKDSHFRVYRKYFIDSLGKQIKSIDKNVNLPSKLVLVLEQI